MLKSKAFLNLARMILLICCTASIASSDGTSRTYNIGDIITLTAGDANNRTDEGYTYLWLVYDDQDRHIDVDVIGTSDHERIFRFYAPAVQDGIIWARLMVAANTSSGCIGAAEARIDINPEVPGSITITPETICAKDSSFKAVYTGTLPSKYTKIFWYLDVFDWDHVVGVDTRTLEIHSWSNIPAGCDSSTGRFLGDRSLNLVDPTASRDHKLIIAIGLDDPGTWPPKIKKEAKFSLIQVPTAEIFISVS